MIAVIGATGHTGKAVAEKLLAARKIFFAASLDCADVQS